MALEAVTEFYNKVSTDSTLQQEIESALEGKEGIEAANAFVQLGAKNGYDFTTKEAIQKQQELLNDAEKELSDEELDSVAGGRWRPRYYCNPGE